MVRTGKQEWVEGWPLVLVSMFGLATSHTLLYSLGVVLPSIEHDRGWTRSEAASGMIIFTAVSMISSPLIGRFVDRWGARRLVLPSFIFYCISLMTLPLLVTSFWSWLAAWVVMGGALSFMSGTVWSAAITTRFESQRALALAVTMCGIGVASTLVPPSAGWLNAHFGWRGVYVGFGAGALVVMTPLLLAFFHDGHGKQNRVTPPSIPLPEMLKLITTRQFLTLAFGGATLTFAVTTITIQFVPLLISANVSPGMAAGAAGLIGVGSVTGRFVTGYILDRSRGPLVCSISFLLPLLACWLLLQVGGSSHAQAFSFFGAIVLGLSAGAEVDLLSYLTSRYFGAHRYGSIFGVIVALMSIGSGTGAWVAAKIFDLTRGYSVLLWSVMPLFVVAAFLIATLGPWKDKDGETAVLPEEALENLPLIAR